MNKMLKKMALSGFTLYLMTSLTACGNDSSSGPTTVPTSATVFYAHNIVSETTRHFQPVTMLSDNWEPVISRTSPHPPPYRTVFS